MQTPEYGPTFALPSLPPAQLSKENLSENLNAAQISTGKRLQLKGMCNKLLNVDCCSGALCSVVSEPGFVNGM